MAGGNRTRCYATGDSSTLTRQPLASAIALRRVPSTPGYTLTTVNYGKLNTIWIQLSGCGFWGHDYLTGYAVSSSMFPNQRLGHRLSNCGPVPLGVRTVLTEQKANHCATVFFFCLLGPRGNVVG